MLQRRHQFAVCIKVGQEKASMLAENCIHDNWKIHKNKQNLLVNVERCALKTKSNNNITQKERERTLVGLTNELKELALKDNSKYTKIVTSLQNVINSLNDECNESTMTSNATKAVFVANSVTNTTGSQNRNQGRYLVLQVLNPTSGTGSNRLTKGKKPNQQLPSSFKVLLMFNNNFKPILV